MSLEGPLSRHTRPHGDQAKPAKEGTSLLPHPWADAPESVLAALETSRDLGLSDGEATRRLRDYGPNRLRETRSKSAWLILWDQLASLIVALLVTAAALAFAFGERVEGFAIVAVILLNTAIGFVTERRAMRSMEALRQLGHSMARVRRDGAVVSLSAERLVPGDLLVLDAGDVLTADLRIVSGSRLQVDESPLTGESLPVDKQVEAVAMDAALTDRASMLFKGTAVTCGSGEAVVVATGMATELGKISSLASEAEPETTPLEKRLGRLGRRLVALTVVVAVFIAAAFVASGRDVFFAIEIAIALAVATIPEGLPVVATVALARGMWRMARRNALVEQLSAVETLGSTTTILVDKTGTLTENRMTAVELRLAGGKIEIGGTGLETTGAFRQDGRPLELRDAPELVDALRIAVLCNNATLGRSADGQIEVTGDPTEVALLVAGAKAGLEPRQLAEAYPEVRELAFDPETKRMATLHEFEGATVAAVKGAPETLIECCEFIQTRAGTEPLRASDREAWLAIADEMAGRGERVLALATQRIDSKQSFEFEKLELIGLVGFFDPPRERVREAILDCQNAGIRVVMVTGDHGATATNVAAAVGLIPDDVHGPSSYIDGRTLAPIEDLSESQTMALLRTAVVARATPRQKLDLIELHQRNGAIVAMTGDGVNDAPALKKADIGVAMGLRGTQVAREAADMVLQDDEFGTIVAAVAQGRAIFANIRKFVVYLMSCNVSEILAVGLGALAQGPLPILPLQILFLNLVTDVFPALALGVSEGSPALMGEPPRDPAEPILTRQHWRTIGTLGAVMACSVLAALATAVLVLDLHGREATTVAFLTLAMAQLWHVFSMRNPASAAVYNEITRNPWIWGALALCLGLLLAAVYWSPLARVLSIVDPGLDGWAVALGMSLVPFVVGQLSLIPRFHRRNVENSVALPSTARGVEQ